MSAIVNFPLLVFALSFAVLGLSAKAGDTLRKKSSGVREDAGHDFGVVLTGALTLLALIIGFSFSMAINRYDLRKNDEQAETTAIAIEYIRTNLLPPGDASRAQELLRNLILPIVVSISLFLISDLDRPRGGAVHVSPQNLIGLSQSLHSR
jgi:hypothetical protein